MSYDMAVFVFDLSDLFLIETSHSQDLLCLIDLSDPNLRPNLYFMVQQLKL